MSQIYGLDEVMLSKQSEKQGNPRERETTHSFSQNSIKGLMFSDMWVGCFRGLDRHIQGCRQNEARNKEMCQ